MDDMQPVTLPLLALRLIVGTAWAEGVNAGAQHGRAAHQQRDQRARRLMVALLEQAEDLARRATR